MSILSYLKEVNAETKNIKWPTKKMTTYFTTGVILISILFAVYIGLTDYVFTGIVDRFIVS